MLGAAGLLLGTTLFAANLAFRYAVVAAGAGVSVGRGVATGVGVDIPAAGHVTHHLRILRERYLQPA